MIWSHERTRRWQMFGPSQLVKTLSNPKLNGPTKLVWFIETFLLVFTAYGLAYVVPQVTSLKYLVMLLEASANSFCSVCIYLYHRTWPCRLAMIYVL